MTTTPTGWRRRIAATEARTRAAEHEFWRLTTAGVNAPAARQLATRPAAVAAGRRTTRHGQAA